MATVTLARLYEDQGHKEDALVIYNEVLRHEPENQEALLAVKRLSGTREKFPGVDQEMLSLFVKMSDPEDFIIFENWLAEWN